MPTYEYRCENGHQFDVVQRMADAAVTECEVCGAPVQRVFHAPAVHFKGKGFYNTDYGTKNRQRELSSAADSGAKKESEKREGKSEKSESSSSSSSSDSGSSSSSSDSGSSPSSSDSGSSPSSDGGGVAKSPDSPKQASKTDS